MPLPVVLYVPNLLGYARILLAFYGLYLSQDDPVQTIGWFVVSASLDLFDGILARALDQQSAFGILLDIAADNILRTCGWLAAAANASSCLKCTAAFIICLEWTTMLATQLHSHAQQQHWKEQRENDPWIVRALFANNFKNPVGILSMYGLFTSYLWAYGAQHEQIYNAIGTMWFDVGRYLSYTGRALSLVVELYFVQSYLAMVIQKDEKKKTN